MKATENIVLEITVPEELRDVLSRMEDAEVEVDVARMTLRITSLSMREVMLERQNYQSFVPTHRDYQITNIK